MKAVNDVAPDQFAFLEAYPDAIAIHRSGILLYANQAVLRLVGATDASQVIGQSVLTFVHPDSLEAVRRKMSEAVTTGTVDFAGERFMTLAAAPIAVEVVVLPIDIGGKHATQVIMRDVTELRRIEAENERFVAAAASADQAARFTEEALALIEDAVGLGVWDWTIATDTLRWTAGLEPLHGMAPGEFRGTFEHFLEAVHPDDRERLMASIHLAMAEGTEFEVRMRVPIGETVRWILGKGRVHRDAAGNPVRMVGIGLDIDERMKVELALAESDSRLRLVTGLLPANVAYIDREERYRFVNESYRTKFNIEPESVIGKTAQEFMSAASYEQVGPLLKRALGGEPGDIELEIHPAGGHIYVHAQYVPDWGEDGTVRGVVAMSNDITSQHVAAEALEARSRNQGLLNALAAALQDAMDTLTVATRTTGTLVERFCHAAALDVLHGGISERVSFASSPESEITNDDLPIAPCDLSRPGEAFVRSVALHTATGERGASALQLWVPVREDRTLVLTVSGEHSGFGASEQRLLLEVGDRLCSAFERAMLFQQLQSALAARDDFLGFTTHELKTPLTVMLGFADLLSRSSGDLSREEVAEISGTLLHAARRLEGVVENMLHLARADRVFEDEPTLLHRVAETVFNARVWASPDRQKAIHVGHSPGMVMSPVGWLEHLVENLLSNAEKYSPPDAPIDIVITGDAHFVTLCVLDRGRGVSEEQAEELFEPFFRANPSEAGVSGIGLGLTVCRKLVDRLGGRIWLRPREGGGTEAGFQLPVVSSFDDERTPGTSDSIGEEGRVAFEMRDP